MDKFEIKIYRFMEVLFLSFTTCLLLNQSVYADAGNVAQIQSFIKNIITDLVSLSGLIATGFFIVGGFRYITSSGNPISLDKAKRTILYSAAGLAITIGAFVLSNIISDMAKSAFGG